MLESQLRTLEEPKDAVVVEASWPSEKIVAAIRKQLNAV
jgi:gluconate kinase